MKYLKSVFLFEIQIYQQKISQKQKNFKYEDDSLVISKLLHQHKQYSTLTANGSEVLGIFICQVVTSCSNGGGVTSFLWLVPFQNIFTILQYLFYEVMQYPPLSQCTKTREHFAQLPFFSCPTSCERHMYMYK